jgi:hypothetical protein
MAGRLMAMMNRASISRRGMLAAASSILLALSLVSAISETAAGAVAVPTVVSVNPGSGPKAGGNVVTLTGSGFVAGSVVTFGGAKSPSVKVVSSSKLYAKAPAHALGVVNVHVRTAAGISRSAPANRYAFVDPPQALNAGPVQTVMSTRGGPTSMSCPTATFCMLVDESGAAVITDGTAQVSRTAISSLTPEFRPRSVSCGTPSFCVAWDDRSVRSYDGSQWSAVQTLVASDDYDKALTSIDCVSPAFCLAGTLSTTAYVFDGATWTDSPPAGLWPLVTFSCVSATFCIGTSGDRHIWRYDGAQWTDQGIEPGFYTYDKLDCISATYCVALTRYGRAYATYNGTAWTEPSLTPASQSTRPLGDFSCASGPECLALDIEGYVLDFDGTTWRKSNQSALSLISVECVTSTLCRVLSYDGFARTFDGTSFGDPVEVDAPRGQITSISCPSASFCAIVDLYGWASTFNGSSWTTPQRIDPTGKLTSLSCPSASTCVAVDDEGHALRYDGNSWSAPTTIDAGHLLTSVSCPSKYFCVAVDNAGYNVTYSNGHWHAPHDLFPADEGRLYGVSCSSYLFCYAVGSAPRRGGVVVRYDGGWDASHAINEYGFTAVSCVSRTFCMVGENYGSVRTYNGATFSRAAPFYSEYVSDVSCVTTRFCNVSYFVDYDQGDTLSTSSVVDGAAVGADASYPDSPSNLSTSCWAVGHCMVSSSTGVRSLG